MSNKAGRPTKYKKEYIEEAKELSLLGYDGARLAKHFGVNISTFNEWKAKNKIFRDTIQESKDRYDAEQVENSLLKRAVTGYKVTEVKVEEDHEGRKKVTKTTREVPADTRAQMYWLNNRNPNRWKNKSKVEVEVNDSPLSIQDLYTATQKNKN
jgi:hypothetical protein